MLCNNLWPTRSMVLIKQPSQYAMWWTANEGCQLDVAKCLFSKLNRGVPRRSAVIQLDNQRIQILKCKLGSISTISSSINWLLNLQWSSYHLTLDGVHKLLSLKDDQHWLLKIFLQAISGEKRPNIFVSLKRLTAVIFVLTSNLLGGYRKEKSVAEMFSWQS